MLGDVEESPNPLCQLPSPPTAARHLATSPPNMRHAQTCDHIVGNQAAVSLAEVSMTLKTWIQNPLISGDPAFKAQKETPGRLCPGWILVVSCIMVTGSTKVRAKTS